MSLAAGAAEWHNPTGVPAAVVPWTPIRLFVLRVSQGLCIWTHSAGLTYQLGCLHRTRLILFLVLSLHKPHFLQALPGGIDPKEYLQQWFCDAPFDQIRQENVREMLTYGFFYRRR